MNHDWDWLYNEYKTHKELYLTRKGYEHVFHYFIQIHLLTQ